VHVGVGRLHLPLNQDRICAANWRARSSAQVAAATDGLVYAEFGTDQHHEASLIRHALGSIHNEALITGLAGVSASCTSFSSASLLSQEFCSDV
jgi:hypothetical protein